MRIGIFDPYFDTLGGGEKYLLSIAKCLTPKHEVVFFWNDVEIKDKIKDRYGFTLKDVRFEKNVFASGSFTQRLFRTRSLDVCIVVSDGSIPFLFAKKNVIIFQFPTPWIKTTLLTRAKLAKVQTILCYSDFVKEHIERILNKVATVLPPAVDQFGRGKEKKNIILSVGRFTGGINVKKHEVLVDVFKKLCEDGLKNWQLIIAGAALPGDESMASSLEKQASSYPVKVFVNLPFPKMVDLYKSAKIYWHAAGYGEDLMVHPERAEHFGITTIEAMSAGVVPVVFAGGGQKEIVQNNKNGFHWTTKDELMEKTLFLISHDNVLKSMGTEGIKQADQYSQDSFCKRLHDIL